MTTPSRGEECFAVAGLANGLECGHALAVAGFDHGTYVGEKVRPPVGAEAVGVETSVKLGTDIV